MSVYCKSISPNAYNAKSEMEATRQRSPFHLHEKKITRFEASQKSSDANRVHYSEFIDVNKEVVAQNYSLSPGNEKKAVTHRRYAQPYKYAHSTCTHTCGYTGHATRNYFHLTVCEYGELWQPAVQCATSRDEPG